MTARCKLVSLAIAAMLAAGAVAAHAQEKVLREGQVTERSLIDALAPPEAASAADAQAAPRTRGFRPAIRPAAAMAGAAATAAHPGRASILVTFVTDSAELTPRAKSALDVLAAAMNSPRLIERHFVIEGHADPRGTDEHNMELSKARANSVRDYLVQQHQLDPQRLSTVGKGSTELMNPNDPTAPENRRVTIVAGS
jgi:outer membrane protein OmpA-like peptidoglycan-associated protein